MVFDLGAHIGTFTIPIAQKVGLAGRVVAVEPCAPHFELLRENVRLNGLEARCHLVNALIAAADQTYKTTTTNIRNSGATYFAPGASDEVIEVTDIDSLSRAYFLPTHIKIDIEGLEVWALKNAKVVQKENPIIYAEISEHQFARYKSTVQEIDDFLRTCGYKFFRNIGERNAGNDFFRPAELARLKDGGSFFDVLAIPRNSVGLLDSRRG
jgi:FkbM family methyltransferase